MAAQDEGELFDVCDRDGSPLGVSKARRQVHRDGDWHRSVHVWVLTVDAPGPLLADAQPWVLFQQRSLAKDTSPGALDVAVGGHYRAGERLEDALREAHEEIGLPLTPSEVTRLGLRRSVQEHPPDLLDRELQDVLLATTNRGLAALRPHPDEVTAIVALPLGAAVRLFRGEVAGALALFRGADDPSGAATLAPREVRLGDFIPARDGYYERALDSIQRRLAGEAPSPWTLG